MKRYVMECIGAMFLVLAYSLTESPLAIGAMLVVLVYMGVKISGSHFNPAVSLAVWVRGKMKAGEMLCYMLAQIFGGLIAAAIYFFIAGKCYYPVPAAWISTGRMFFIEALFTFFFCTVFLNVMTSRKFTRNGSGVYGLIVGFALMAIVFLGATFNPAVSVGPAMFDLLFSRTLFVFLPAHALGALLGGALAGLGYRYLNVDQAK